MNKRFIWLVLSLVCFFSIQAQAKELRIAFVNGQLIFQKYRGDIDKRLDKEFGGRKDKIISLQEELKSKSEKLNRDEAVLSVTEAKKMQQEIELKQRDYQRLSQAYQEDFNLRGNQELQILGEKLQTIIDKVAHEQNFDVVLQRGAAVFVDKKFDITEQVVTRLEKSKA